MRAEVKEAVEAAAPEDAAAPLRAEAATESDVCPSCGAALAGDYCQACGEKRPGARDLTLRHFVADTAREVTSLDSKLFRTLWALLFRPGRLTNEWVAGRRVPYLKPLNLCLGIFAVSLFFMTASKNINVFDIRYIIETEPQTAKKMGLPGDGRNYERIFAEIARRKNVPPESLYDTFNDKWQRNVSLLGPVQIIALAVLLQIIYLYTRRYFVEHLVFSMHFLAFSTLMTVLLLPLYFFTGIHMSGASLAVAGVKFLLDIVYLFFAQRAVYRDHPVIVVVGAVFVFLGYLAIYTSTNLAALAAAIVSIMLR